MIEPRMINLPREAISAIFEILGIMSDQLMEGNMASRWDAEAVVDLQRRLSEVGEDEAVPLGIDDAALLLDGRAFTEMMSVSFPFFEMVQWTTEFVTSELRSHWSDEIWLAYAAQ
jgi:hypothetical protein